MKKIKFQLLMVAIVFTTNFFYSCKSKNAENTNTPAATVDTPAAATPAPVTISGDNILNKGVADAVKDYPNVKADVIDSIINLTGEIKRADWQKLNPTLNSLHPKRINSTNLTIK